MLLAERTALVTGGAGGIGRAIGLLFAQEGAEVALCDLNGERARAAAAEIEAGTGQRTLARAVDVRDARTVDDGVDELGRELGRIDILVNAAGVLQPSPLVEMTEELWDLHLDVNLKGAFLMCRAVCRFMLDKGGCKIVNVASDSALAAFPHEAAYAASKAGLLALTRSIALDLGPRGVYCNAVCPGATRTPMLQALFDRNPDLEGATVAGTSLGRIAEPLDVARAALFLASGLSDHITGERIVVTGGSTMSQ
ncbi:MAG: SDR family oxidoreductase [Spirochaetales bacterium]|nr:SDR family oxidoreductase [Spirochaetales bacterium]